MNKAEPPPNKKPADTPPLASAQQSVGEQQSLTVQHALELGVLHHNSGRLPEAEKIYQQILQADPNQPVALHLLGVVAHQFGKNEPAVNLIEKALVQSPDYSEAHCSLGNVLRQLGRLNEAVISYGKALTIVPESVEARCSLGNTLMRLGKLEEAVANFRHAVAVKPDQAQAHQYLGIALKQQGKLDAAVTSYQKALALKSDYVDAHYNLGNALWELGKFDDAVISYQNALTLRPDMADAHSNLGLVYEDLGRPDEGLTCHRRAASLNPQNRAFWGNFAAALAKVPFISLDEELLQDLQNLIEQPSMAPSVFFNPVLRALRQHPVLTSNLDLIEKAEPDSALPCQQIAEELSTVSLFLGIMKLAPIPDLKIEQMLTRLRPAMLENALSNSGDETTLPFATALALHCFTNEYVYLETHDEERQIDRLQQRIAELIELSQNIPPSWIAALGSYRPLYIYPWAAKLTDHEGSGDICEVITRQISEPLTERALRAQLPCLTPVQDTVSKAVRQQYEENPYPRWVRTSLATNAMPIAAVLCAAPLHFDLGDHQISDNPDILIAGCGTGQHALGSASRYANARVLAVDLSLSSLSYAARKTRELGVSNIEYAQADIREMDRFERHFDLIESVGVLHHMADPVAGWKVLVDLLKPQGLMRIGLYSETARQPIVAGRSLIADAGYTNSPQDIRRCRHDILSKSQNGDRTLEKLLKMSDFHSLSECRDLLFHVQEHRFTIPEIEDALNSLQLEFLGFEIENRTVMRKFKDKHPDETDLTSLSHWHDFEQQNPDTFASMYQFWCRKF